MRDGLLVRVRGARVAAAHEQNLKQTTLASSRGEVRGARARRRKRARVRAGAEERLHDGDFARLARAARRGDVQRREPVARPGRVRVHPGAQERARDVGASGRARLEERRELATARAAGKETVVVVVSRRVFVFVAEEPEPAGVQERRVRGERRSPQELRRGERPRDGVERARAVLFLAEGRGGFALAQTRARARVLVRFKLDFFVVEKEKAAGLRSARDEARAEQPCGAERGDRVPSERTEIVREADRARVYAQRLAPDVRDQTRRRPRRRFVVVFGVEVLTRRPRIFRRLPRARARQPRAVEFPARRFRERRPRHEASGDRGGWQVATGVRLQSDARAVVQTTF